MPKISEWESGVYKWTNLINGKVYVGSATRGISIRLNEYLRNLPRGKCHNLHLQNAWNKYGAEAFEFSVLERCSPEQCLEREEVWIKHLNATDPDCGYNLCTRGRSAFGIKRSEETKAKQRLFKPSEEHKAKLVEANQNRIWSPKDREARRLSLKKNWADPKYRRSQLLSRMSKGIGIKQVLGYKKRSQKLISVIRGEGLPAGGA